MTAARPFDSTIRLNGIRSWVEIETPTGHEQRYIASLEPRAGLLCRLCQTLR